jgi:hypothetical protein
VNERLEKEMNKEDWFKTMMNRVIKAVKNAKTEREKKCLDLELSDYIDEMNTILNGRLGNA